MKNLTRLFKNKLSEGKQTMSSTGVKRQEGRITRGNPYKPIHVGIQKQNLGRQTSDILHEGMDKDRKNDTMENLTKGYFENVCE